MIPQIRTQYLATSRSGRVVMSFDSPARCREFCAESARKGVRLEAVEETTIRKPLLDRAIAEPARVKLKAVEG